MLLKEINFKKWYYSKKLINSRRYYIYDVDIDEEDNFNLIFNFTKKVVTGKLILLLSLELHDDMASIYDYINIQKKYNKNGDRFEYIYNSDYRSQLVLVLTQSDRFNAESFKELLNLYSGIRIYLDSNTDYDELYEVGQSRERLRKKQVYDYDSMLLYEDELTIYVSDITKYPNLEESIHMFFSQK